METSDVFKLKQNLLGMFIIGPKLWLSSLPFYPAMPWELRARVAAFSVSKILQRYENQRSRNGLGSVKRKAVLDRQNVVAAYSHAKYDSAFLFNPCSDFFSTALSSVRQSFLLCNFA